MGRQNRVIIDYRIKESDTLPPITAEFVDDGGSVVDLTNATSVTFRMAEVDTGTLNVDAAATIDDAATGQVSYHFAPADTATPGLHVAEFVAEFPDDNSDGNPEQMSYPPERNLGIEIVEGVNRP